MATCTVLRAGPAPAEARGRASSANATQSARMEAPSSRAGQTPSPAHVQ
jgi:hypothetical protein